MFQTPIATGQHVGRKNLIFRNGDDTHIHNQDEVLYTYYNGDYIEKIDWKKYWLLGLK